MCLEQAEALAKLLRQYDLCSHVNLIPWYATLSTLTLGCPGLGPILMRLNNA